MICPNCHAEVNDSQAFCGNCGTPLAKPEPTATPYEGNYQQPVEVVAEPIPASASQQPSENPQTSYGTAQQPIYGAAYTQQDSQGQYYNQPNFPQGGYSYDHQPQQPVSNTPFGLAIAALVCSLLGIFPVAIVLAIVALVMNSNQKKSGITSTKQTPTFVMSVISLVVSALVALTVFLFSAAIIASINDGSYVSPSSSQTTTTQSSSSSTTTTSSGAATTASTSSSTSSASSSSTTSATTGTLSSGAAAASSNFVGTWEVVSVVSNGNEQITEDVLQLMHDMNVTFDLVINEDGTFSLNLIEETATGTWKELSDGSAGLTIDGETIIITLDGNDKLLMTDGADAIVFQRK